MKVLLCHNYYQQRGGEDQSFEDEATLLESHGHEVVRYTRHNDDIVDLSSLTAAHQTLWSRRTYAELRLLLTKHRPQLMHCTNTFPLISPSAYYAARKEGVPVVQAVRNYRMLCPKAIFTRGGKVCEDCLYRRVPWPGVVHKCYRDSRTASAVVAALIGWQRLSRMWHKLVGRFYTLSQFARAKLIEGGLPANRIDVKPNFVSSASEPGTGLGGYAVFVGRLSAEKGVATLLEAWSEHPNLIPLKIVGDGPLADQVRNAAATDGRITWVGHQPLAEVCRIVGKAACLVMPSLCYETFGRTIIEAYSVGTPVIASRTGAIVELVEEDCTGHLFDPGNPSDLAAKVDHFITNSSGWNDLRHAARREYESKYTANANYRALSAIYERACGEPLLTDPALIALGAANE